MPEAPASPTGMSVPTVILPAMGRGIPSSLRESAEFQGGIVTRKQALSAGLSAGEIVSKFRYARWQVVYRGVYATFTGPLCREARLWAAILYAGRGAELSYETAAEFYGLAARRAPLIHVSVPASRRVQPAPGLSIHVSARAGATRFPRGVLPRTSVADTILDLAEAASGIGEIQRIVVRAIERGLTGEGELRVSARKRRRLRWRAEFGEIVAAAARQPA